MLISDTWNQHDPATLGTQLRLGSTRFLFGIPCLFIGVYFLYKYLSMGLVAHGQVGDWAGVAREAGGWIAIIISLLFLLPQARNDQYGTGQNPG